MPKCAGDIQSVAACFNILAFHDPSRFYQELNIPAEYLGSYNNPIVKRRYGSIRPTRSVCLWSSTRNVTRWGIRACF